MDSNQRLRTYGQSYKGIVILPIQHIGHKNHLCYLVSRGDVTLEEMKYFVKDAQYICKKCGRAAAREENLCEPVLL